MRCIRNLAVAVMAVAVVSDSLMAQRRVNTGQAAPQRNWEFGIDPLAIEYGVDDPSYLMLTVPGARPILRAARYFAPALALDGRIGWNTTVRENAVGRSSYAVDVGLMLGLTDLDPDTRATYVRPGVMISGSTLPGSQDFTTLTGAFGWRRPWHRVILQNEIQLNQQLESGATPSRLYIDYRMGVTIRP